MTENTVQTEQESLTAKDILTGVMELQRQLVGNEMGSLNKSADTIICILQNENIEEKMMTQQTKEIREMFAMRETTLLKMLAFYEKMFDELNKAQSRKVEIIKSAFSEQVESISKSDLNKEDKYAAIGDVTYQIAELTDKLLFPGTINKARDRVVAEMSYIIKSPDTNDSSKAFAADVLKSYMEWQTND